MGAFLSLAFLAAVLRISVPYVLAALGGTWSERAGIINIALEGLLLTGAFAATIGAYASGSAVVGITAGALAGALLAALYALLVIRFGADQIVCGIAINLLADGATRFLLKVTFDSSSNSPLMLVTALLIGLSHVLLYRTPFGLRVRAVGEHPEAAASLGVRPRRVRLVAVLLSGALAGLGGAWLAADQHQFVAGMSNGRGYIALAAMIFGKWRPTWVAAAALLFGAAEATQIALQTAGVGDAPFDGRRTAGVGLPAWAVQMLPYVLTMVALSGFMGRAKAPSSLGKRDEA